ncbi:hypothetical protein Pmani_034642 [Petrolisthes manimaculis]|uniref:Uncharacterized protein n=1 Tax=Petrolisthes manimaculis TaxID=1843537 RepID=A0AAE1NNZ5_9EUCA|nr:hypothetical protein Pmani_034642 [Petrolisthes manimaculis]
MLLSIVTSTPVPGLAPPPPFSMPYARLTLVATRHHQQICPGKGHISLLTQSFSTLSIRLLSSLHLYSSSTPLFPSSHFSSPPHTSLSPQTSPPAPHTSSLLSTPLFPSPHLPLQ